MKPRIAVLGFGSIGRRHFANLRSLGATELAVFDPFAAKSFQDAPFFDDLDELWNWRPNVALVTAPTAQHLELSLQAARRGCHLFIEKPLSHQRAGLSELINEAEQRGLTTMVGCNMRFHPAHVFLHRQLQTRALGEVLSSRFFCGSYLPDWRVGTDFRASYSADLESGGAILDCIHELDLALWHLGKADLVAAAHRPAFSLGLQTDGIAELMLRHRSGALSSVHLNFVQRDYRRGFEVIGADATLRWDWKFGRVERCDENGAATVLEIGADWEINQMYLDEISAFLGAVSAGEAAPNPIIEAAQTLEIALQARERGDGA